MGSANFHPKASEATVWPYRSCALRRSPDPVLYRLYEVLVVYGYPLKHLIHEKFGDGIMSAIDFEGHVDKIEDPKGDRVKITLSGKVSRVVRRAGLSLMRLTDSSFHIAGGSAS